MDAPAVTTIQIIEQYQRDNERRMDELRAFLDLYEKTYMATNHHPTRIEEAAVMAMARELRKQYCPLSAYVAISLDDVKWRQP